MREKIANLFGGKKKAEQEALDALAEKRRTNPHNIKTSLHVKKKGEIVKVQFFVPALCLDTDHADDEPIVQQTIKPGVYEMIKCTLLPGATNTYWYLFKGDSRGLTEISLNKLVKNDQARIITT